MSTYVPPLRSYWDRWVTVYTCRSCAAVQSIREDLPEVVPGGRRPSRRILLDELDDRNDGNGPCRACGFYHPQGRETVGGKVYNLHWGVRAVARYNSVRRWWNPLTWFLSPYWELLPDSAEYPVATPPPPPPYKPPIAEA